MRLSSLVRELREATFDVDAVAAQFLSITPAKRVAVTQRYLQVVLPAYTAGLIYNTDYQDAKASLSRTTEQAYEERIQAPYLWGKGFTPEGELTDKLGSIMGLHSCISASKRLAKLKPEGQFGDDLRTFFAAVTPLALLMNELKAKIIKGKKPNPEAIAKKAAMNLNKIVKTCACCFRGIAVLGNGKIADHGYTLPQQWQKTASCPGRDFRPLEVSSDGLVYMVDALTRRVKTLKTQQAGIDKIKSLTRKTYKGSVTVTPDSPDWGSVLKSHVASLESELAATEGALKDFENKLAKWKPVGPTESMHSLVLDLRQLTEGRSHG